VNGRIRVRRGDFATQTARRLAARHGLVVVEDLKVKQMTATAKGTVAAPGRNVRQKARLNRAILDKGWGRFHGGPAVAGTQARKHASTVPKSSG